MLSHRMVSGLGLFLPPIILHLFFLPLTLLKNPFWLNMEFLSMIQQYGESNYPRNVILLPTIMKDLNRVIISCFHRMRSIWGFSLDSRLVAGA